MWLINVTRKLWKDKNCSEFSLSIIFHFIRFTCKFCYWHRQKSSKNFLRRFFPKKFRKILGAYLRWTGAFIKLYVDRWQIYKNSDSWWMFPDIFRKRLYQRFGSPITLQKLQKFKEKVLAGSMEVVNYYSTNYFFS